MIDQEQKKSMGGNRQAYLPGIPDSIVKNHIWPQVGKSFRQIAACQHAQKEAILETLFSLHLLNKAWKHLVSFSYECAVYQTVWRDFNEEWCGTPTSQG